MPPIISVQNLRKTYGKTVAVDDISFEVAEGEIFGLLGPNGAGKTTTVECLQSLRSFDSGEIRVCGLDPRKEAETLRKRIGSQLQESALPDRLKVWEALDLFASASSNALDWRTLLGQWGLAEKRKASFSALSGGQRQRLFIALALVNNPKLVFLDEMTTGLDPAARHVAWDLIKSVRERGTTVVLVTHFMDEAENLCDRLAIVDKGRIIASDSPHGMIMKNTSETRVIFTAPGEMPWLAQVSGVKKVFREGPRIEIEGSGPLLCQVAAALVQHGITPADLRVEQMTLEDVFLKLTGHSAGE
ncbi:MAG TPA: ABC transporter ATP-binding protein [Dehalococcoidales bacterium]|nr:ABC transporter ATP-binding protein [Dehalococcoidales bacterium]